MAAEKGISWTAGEQEVGLGSTVSPSLHSFIPSAATEPSLASFVNSLVSPTVHSGSFPHLSIHCLHTALAWHRKGLVRRR